jgi:hypothetical protein
MVLTAVVCCCCLCPLSTHFAKLVILNFAAWDHRGRTDSVQTLYSSTTTDYATAHDQETTGTRTSNGHDKSWNIVQLLQPVEEEEEAAVVPRRVPRPYSQSCKKSSSRGGRRLVLLS